MHNRSALWQRRKINHCDLTHGRVEIKPSHVENRLSVTPPVASRAPSPHTITCKRPLRIQKASELLGALWWTGLLVCHCCVLTLLYVTPFDQVEGKFEWGEGVCHLWASDHDMPVHMSFVSWGFIVTLGSHCKTCIFSPAKSQRLEFMLSSWAYPVQWSLRLPLQFETYRRLFYGNVKSFCVSAYVELEIMAVSKAHIVPPRICG